MITEASRHDFARVQGMLEAIRVASVSATEAAQTAANTYNFRLDGAGDMGDPLNPTLEILSRLKRDLDSLMHRAKEAIQEHMHDSLAGR